MNYYVYNIQVDKQLTPRASFVFFSDAEAFVRDECAYDLVMIVSIATNKIMQVHSPMVEL